MSSNENVLAEYISRQELAKQLSRTERTLARWEELRLGPAVTKVGKQPFYRIATVRDWLKSRELPMPRDRSQRRVAQGAAKLGRSKP